MFRRMIGVAAVGFIGIGSGSAVGQCVVPDNGFGTATMPPVGCTYFTTGDNMRIVDGLPAGDTIEIDARIENFFNVSENPGGFFGGTTASYGAQLVMPMQGTGSLSGFSRFIVMQLPDNGLNFFDTFPRNNGDTVQPFEMQLRSLFGEVFGDPDFCTLRVIAGQDNGLPSAGQTVIGSMPANMWQVDSFFDINYRIEFQGCPGSVLEGMSGATELVARFSTDLCPPDLNNDGLIDTADLGILIGNFGTPGPLGDLNGDGIVDTADLGILIAQFGQFCFPV